MNRSPDHRLRNFPTRETSLGLDLTIENQETCQSLSHLSIELFMRQTMTWQPLSLTTATAAMIMYRCFMNGQAGSLLPTWQEGPSKVHVSVQSTQRSMTAKSIQISGIRVIENSETARPEDNSDHQESIERHDQ